MKFIIQYARQKQKTIYMMLLFFGIFVVVDLLYQLPLAIVIYPVCICFIFGMLAFVFGAQKEKEKLHLLKKMEQNTQFSEFSFPETTNQVEYQYQVLLETFLKQYSENEMKTQEKYEQMLDYFTLWVHQIKTPIASMRLTLGRMDSEESRRLSSDLTRVEQYVAMVLTYLRLDFSTTDYVLREYDLDEMIRSVIRKFAPDFIAKKVRLEYKDVCRKMITDEKWFSFVLEQILSNAIKYTQKGSVSIYCQEQELVIEDTGIGISPMDLPRIFEKGFTGFNGRVNKKASGIGLYLCKCICEELGVELRAESVVEKGTRIILSIGQEKLDVRD